MKKFLIVISVIGVTVFLSALLSFFGIAVFWLLFGWSFRLVRLIQSEPLGGMIAMIALFLILSALVHLCFKMRKTGESRNRRRFSRSFALNGLVFTFLLSGLALSITLHEGSRFVLHRNTIFSDWFLLRNSESNMNRIGIAVCNYMDRYPKPVSIPEDYRSTDFGKVWGDQTFPSGGTVLEDGRPGHGWATQLLPYLGETALYERIDISEPWDDPHNAAVYREETPAVFRSSSRPRDREFYRNREGFGLTDYAANQMAMPYGRPLPINYFLRGISNTLLLGEANEKLKPWGHPLNGRDPRLGLNRTPLGFGSGRHRSDVVLFILGDGSVRPVSVDIEDRFLKLMADPKSNNYHFDDIHDF